MSSVTTLLGGELFLIEDGNRIILYDEICDIILLQSDHSSKNSRSPSPSDCWSSREPCANLSEPKETAAAVFGLGFKFDHLEVTKPLIMMSP